MIESFEGRGLPADEFKAKTDAFTKAVSAATVAAGYPAKADPARSTRSWYPILLLYLVVLVTMVYGPIAAMLVELFPTRIRYTSMSLPYHIGNGWFGGFLPTISFAMVAAHGRHLLRPLVPDRDRRDDVRGRHVLRPRDQGSPHRRVVT